MESGLVTTTVQELISQVTSRHSRVIAVLETDLASPGIHTAMTGHIIDGIGSAWHLVYADMALTIIDYIWNEHKI